MKEPLKEINMDNKLAENMLRFGVKNLSDASKKKLSEQAPVDNSKSPIAAALTKINANIPKFIDDAIKSDLPSEMLSIPDANMILYYNNDRATGAESTGYLEIYKIVVTSLGVPAIVNLSQFLNRKGKDWRTSQLDDFTPVETPQAVIADAGNTPVDQLNTLWSNAHIGTAGKDMEKLKTTAVALIRTKADVFKPAFLKITRTPWAIKYYWGDNPNKFNGSQYFLNFVSKIKEESARDILAILQDNELIANIIYKTKNFQSNGVYPTLVIPKPMQ